MFRTSEFERYALGEGQHVARYLLGRYAMHKAAAHVRTDPPRGRSHRVG